MRKTLFHTTHLFSINLIFVFLPSYQTILLFLLILEQFNLSLHTDIIVKKRID